MGGVYRRVFPSFSDFVKFSKYQTHICSYFFLVDCIAAEIDEPFTPPVKGEWQNTYRLGLSRCDISSWWNTFGRPWCDARFRSGVSCHPPGLNPLRRGWVYRPAPEALLLGECRRGPRHFWKCRACVGFGPAPGPTLKKALRYTRPVDGTEDKISSSQEMNIWPDKLVSNSKRICFHRVIFHKK